jgi:hypothetical protein
MRWNEVGGDEVDGDEVGVLRLIHIIYKFL